MALPQWIQPYLREEGLARIETAVRNAEKRAHGQIVPMVVRSSSPGSHVTLTLALLLLALAYGLNIDLTRAHLPWGHWAWLPLDFALALLCGSLLARMTFVRRWFTPLRDRHHAAFLRAKAGFYDHGVGGAKASNGILLFISLEDRHAVVLADKGIAAKVPAETWDRICLMLQRGAAQGDLANAFQAAIAACASILEKPFPAKRGDRNELQKSLVIEE